MQVPLIEFCRRAAAQSVMVKHIVAEQIVAVMGGFSNLYVEQGIARKMTEFDVDTERGFVSELVPLDALLVEISHCSGRNIRFSDRILTALEVTLRDYFQDSAVSAVGLKCLGSFHPSDLSQSRYQLHFKDPAAEHRFFPPL